MGTPDFAVASLDTLINNGYPVVGVITAPDKPAGRGRKLQESPVKIYANQKGLPILQPTNLKDGGFLDQLRNLEPDLQIVVAFRMLPKAVWGLPGMGTFNLHASLLPDYRGAAPINWAIMNGEKETGATTFFIDDKIDTGEILLQVPCQITGTDTAGILHDRLMHLGADLVLQTVKELEIGNIKPKRQQEGVDLKPAHKLDRQTCELDWKLPMADIYNKIRGLSPFPTAWTTLHHGDETYFLKIYGASMEKVFHTEAVGTVIANKNEMKVAVKDGFINLLEIQLPGKRRMETKEVLNGLKLKKNAYVG